MREALRRLWRSLADLFAGRAIHAPARAADPQPGAEPHPLQQRDWYRKPGASPEAIEYLRSVAPFPLPDSYVDLLRYSNGGAGPMAANPFMFALDPAEEVARHHLDGTMEEFFPGLFFIAGTGGCSRIAFDLREGEPYPLVTVGCCGGELEDAILIAPSFDAALDLIGFESDQIEDHGEETAEEMAGARSAS